MRIAIQNEIQRSQEFRYDHRLQKTQDWAHERGDDDGQSRIPISAGWFSGRLC
jgi:hypothetical protein